MYVYVYVQNVFVYVCACVRVRVCVHTYTRVCVHAFRYVGLCTLTCFSDDMTLACPHAGQRGESVSIVCTFTDFHYSAIQFFRYNDVCARCVIYSKCEFPIPGYSAVVKTGEKATLTIQSFNPKVDAALWTCSLMHHRRESDQSHCTIHSKYMQKQQLFHTHTV